MKGLTQLVAFIAKGKHRLINLFAYQLKLCIDTIVVQVDYPGCRLQCKEYPDDRQPPIEKARAKNE